MNPQVDLFVASIVLLGVGSAWGANWALLVAGSNGWYNYRHQSDVCHAYQILHKNGIPDSNIVVMMYDDLAQNTQNPTKGIIVNHVNGPDVYHGVPKDYTGDTVTPKNFINILLGDKAAMKGIGSGKVIDSGPGDNIFVYYTDHGAVDLVAFPAGGYLYAKDLNTTIFKLHDQKKYKQMVIYIESCESGSMVEGFLPNNINIYATTASWANESSYACYYDATRQTYLGDCYSVAWMEDSDAEQISKETLFHQFQITKQVTTESHAMQYGDLKLGQTHNVGEFQGAGEQIETKPRDPVIAHFNNLRKRDAVATEDVRISIVSRRLAAAENSAEKERLRNELVQLLNDRSTIQNRINQIAGISLSINSGSFFGDITQKRMKLTQHDCYKSVTQHIDEKCFDLGNEFVLNKLWIVANLCEIGLHDFTIKQAVNQACPTRLHFDY